jgi:hypothetical protein
MAKNIYLQFENDRVVAISLNMSDDHLAVYSNKFGISLNDLIAYRDDAKVIYINLDSEHIIAYIDKQNKMVYSTIYIQFIQQNFKKTFLYSLKPLGTPKLPKVRKPQVETLVEKVVDIEVVKLPVVLEVDSILDKIGKYGINSITKEEKDFLDNLN